MKRLFGILGMVLVVSFLGCATNVEKGDELAQQSKTDGFTRISNCDRYNIKLRTDVIQPL